MTQLETESKPFSEDCQIEATNDLEAVQGWLQHYSHNLNTYKSYYKEARRFLLWCIYERGLSLGALKVQDVEQYFHFLKAPPHYWYLAPSDAAKERREPWLPLKSPLSEAACRMSIRAINSLLNYLVKADYLRSNPIKLLPTTITKSLEMDIQKYKVWERMLEGDEWEAVQKALQSMPIQSKKDIDNKMRTQFLFALLYLLGLRIHEVAISSWNAFRRHNGAWWFFIKGKGGKLGHIPVNDQLLAYIKAYRVHLGLTPLPDLEERTHLLVSKKSKKPLKVRQLYGLVKAIGMEAAKSFEKQPLKKQKLEHLSPHWLRHLSASHQDRAGIPATVIQANHRHNSAQTTQIYLHAEDELRASEIQKLKMAIEPEFIHQSASPQKYELKIKLKGKSVSERLNFGRFLESIENHVFKNYSWVRDEYNKEALLEQFEYLRRFGSPLQFSYYFESLDKSLLGLIKQLIAREASVRLFECEVEWRNKV